MTVLEHPATPPSLNELLYRHWRIERSQKKTWQDTFERLLLAAGCPEFPRGCFAHAALRFPTRRRRDADNYAAVLSKALGDALVVMAAIPDDTPNWYRFGRLDFDPQLGQARTRVELAALR